MALPLDGIRILDLTSVVLGPYATMTLADMGAEIVKVEAPDGDMVRNIGAGRNPKMGPMHLSYNRGKRSLAIDLKADAGKKAFLRLVATADALVHNMRPQAMKGLGLDYDSIRKIKPDIVYCGAYGFGSAGPYAAKAAFDDVIQGASGIASLMSAISDRPSFAPMVVADKTTGLMLACCTLAALVDRARTGRGRFVEVPMFETMVSYTMVEHMWQATFVPPAGPAGYPRVMTKERRPHRTKDGWVSILPYSTENWRDFFAMGGRPQLGDDPRFADVALRTKHATEIYAIVSEIAATKTTGEWVALCDAKSIPCTKVNSVQDLFDDPHLKAVGMFGEVEHPSEGKIRNIRAPFAFGEEPREPKRQAPRLGEHSIEILREAGLDGSEIDALISAKIVIQTERFS
jgi:formyl-CoA transferase